MGAALIMTLAANGQPDRQVADRVVACAPAFSRRMALSINVVGVVELVGVGAVAVVWDEQVGQDEPQRVLQTIDPLLNHY
jgi:hypothetical protein